EAEGVRVGELAMLFKALAVVAALHVMKTAGVAAVVPGKDAAQLVDLDTKGVAAPLAKDFETALFRMIAPDMLADHVGDGCLVAGALDVGGNGAAVGAVDPAVRAPAQAVGHRVGVLQPEACEMDDRVARRLVGIVLGRIKEEIRGIEDPDAAPPAQG